MIISQLSYDTLHIYTEKYFGTEKEIEYLSNQLDKFESKYLVKSEHSRYFGYLKNLRVSINSNRINIKGSIAKYLNSNNLEPLLFEDISIFYDDLYKLFKIDSKDWNVTRIDLGLNVELDYPVMAYLPFIGGAKYKTHNQFGTTLYLSSTEKLICFYDKIKELKKTSNCNVPESYLNKNILRLEFRVKKNISKHLNTNFVTSYNRLQSNECLEACKSYCKAQFESIRFIHSDLEVESISKPKDIDAYLILKGVEAIGLPTLEKIVKSLNKLNLFKHKYYASRYLSSLRKKVSNNSLVDTNPLIQEIREKVLIHLN